MRFYFLAELAHTECAVVRTHNPDNRREDNQTDAQVTDEQLAQATSLKGAAMPDGTKHD